VSRFWRLWHARPLPAVAAAGDNRTISDGELFTTVPAPHVKAMAVITFADLDNHPARADSAWDVLTPQDAPMSAFVFVLAKAQTFIVDPAVFVDRRFIFEKSYRDCSMGPLFCAFGPASSANDDASRGSAVSHHSFELFDVSDIDRSGSAFGVDDYPGGRATLPSMINQYVNLAQFAADFTPQSHIRKNGGIDVTVSFADKRRNTSFVYQPCWRSRVVRHRP